MLGRLKYEQANPKLPGLTLLLVLLLSCLLTVVPVHAMGPFSEVPRDHWSYQAVERLFAMGLINDPIYYELFALGYPVSRYEMAIWTAAALETMTQYSQVDGNKALVLNTKTSNQLVQVNKLAATYNQLHPNRALSEADMQMLDRLVVYLADPLSRFGYQIPYAGGTMMAASDFLYSFPSAGQTAFNIGGGVLTLGPTAELSGTNQFTQEIWRSTYGGSDTSTAPVGLGFSLQLGGLLFSAGRGVVTGDRGNTETTALGLRYRVSNMDFQVEYASEVGQGLSMQDLSGRRTATASLEYTIAPENLASAGLTLTGDQSRTSADFGLRYRIQDATVSLGYRLVDYAKDQPINKVVTNNNVATAEFSISF